MAPAAPISTSTGTIRSHDVCKVAGLPEDGLPVASRAHHSAPLTGVASHPIKRALS